MKAYVIDNKTVDVRTFFAIRSLNYCESQLPGGTCPRGPWLDPPLDMWLQIAVGAYRTAPQASIGFSPAELLYGRALRLPADIQLETPLPSPSDPLSYIELLKTRHAVAKEIVDAHITAAQERQKRNFHSNSSATTFQLGDLVYLSHPAVIKGQSTKLRDLFDGPYRVKAKKGEVNYVIQPLHGGRCRCVHRERLRPCYRPNHRSDAIIPENSTGKDNSCEVEKSASPTNQMKGNPQDKTKISQHLILEEVDPSVLQTVENDGPPTPVEEQPTLTVDQEPEEPTATVQQELGGVASSPARRVLEDEEPVVDEQEPALRPHRHQVRPPVWLRDYETDMRNNRENIS